jgi:hypothetical protein
VEAEKAAELTGEEEAASTALAEEEKAARKATTAELGKKKEIIKNHLILAGGFNREEYLLSMDRGRGGVRKAARRGSIEKSTYCTRLLPTRRPLSSTTRRKRRTTRLLLSAGSLSLPRFRKRNTFRRKIALLNEASQQRSFSLMSNLEERATRASRLCVPCHFRSFWTVNLALFLARRCLRKTA